MRIIILALALSVAALPQTETRSRDSAVGTNVSDSNVDYIDSMADYFRNSRRAVLAIRDKGIPDLEIPAVLTIARRSSASPNQVIDARKAGKSWSEIATQWKVESPGDDFVSYANVQFLADYHGRTPDEIQALRKRGASFIDINQELRRSGTPMPKKTPVPAEKKD